MCGGFNQARKAGQEEQEVANSVRDEVEKQLNQKFDKYEAHSVTTQVVAGTNYKIKVHIGDEKYIHIKVYQRLPHEGSVRSLSNVEGDKTVDSVL